MTPSRASDQSPGSCTASALAAPRSRGYRHSEERIHHSSACLEWGWLESARSFSAREWCSTMCARSEVFRGLQEARAIIGQVDVRARNQHRRNFRFGLSSPSTCDRVRLEKGARRRARRLALAPAYLLAVYRRGSMTCRVSSFWMA